MQSEHDKTENGNAAGAPVEQPVMLALAGVGSVSMDVVRELELAFGRLNLAIDEFGHALGEELDSQLNGDELRIVLRNIPDDDPTHPIDSRPYWRRFEKRKRA